MAKNPHSTGRPLSECAPEEAEIFHGFLPVLRLLTKKIPVQNKS